MFPHPSTYNENMWNFSIHIFAPRYLSPIRLRFNICKIKIKTSKFGRITGTSERLFFSRVISLSVIVFYLSLLPQHLSYIGKNIELMTGNLEYDQFIRTLPTITIRCQQVIIPFIAWNKSKLMHVHWNNWKKFQVILPRNFYSNKFTT